MFIRDTGVGAQLKQRDYFLKIIMFWETDFYKLFQCVAARIQGFAEELISIGKIWMYYAKYKT
jgi:hypothetical protein